MKHIKGSWKVKSGKKRKKAVRKEAKARLIAAAPELLGLLKDILEWDGILPHSKTRIEQAIAKAEG